MRASWIFLAAWLACVVAACSEEDRSGGLSPLAQQGQRVYQNVCIACHHGDPTKDGSAGPAIAGSSRALIEARVLRAQYPPGYQPKRPGNAMPAFPYLANDIDALAAYLSEVASAAGTAASRPGAVPSPPAGEAPTG